MSILLRYLPFFLSSLFLVFLPLKLSTPTTAPAGQVLSVESEDSFLESQNLTPPTLTAKSVLAITHTDHTVLFSKNPDDRLHPASLTKIITALTARTVYDESDILTVVNAADSLGHTAELRAGDELVFTDMLHSLLIPSGNDAAVTIAENYKSGGYTAFVARMNDYAVRHNLSNSHFSNVSGLSDAEHYTSASDMAYLGSKLLEDRLLAEIVLKQDYTFESNTGKSYTLNTTNLLLARGALGIKTGWTPDAQECLVSAFNIHGRVVVIAVLGSEDRFGETMQIVDYLEQNYR